MFEHYFKSFKEIDGTLQTQTFHAHKHAYEKVQTLQDVLEQGAIIPNTIHKGWERRLCVSALSVGYSGGYRPQGVVFTTFELPAYVAPTDLLALTDARDGSSANHASAFLSGAERFIFDYLSDMLKAYPYSEKANDAVDRFRASHGLPPFGQGPVEYNECCFTKSVSILPEALIGTSEQVRSLATRFQLPLYASTREYLTGRR